jgi:U3 small nucleolar RNA-associated protein MPP10
VTASIEEIIKARIKDGLFDDVLRTQALERGRYRPKAAELSTEKSKLGLGEQYAEEYEQKILGAASAESAAEEKVHTAARELFAKLGGRLDALFNFHATPRPFKAEATVRASVSTVALEEAMPTAMAAHEALAPEEVLAPRKGRQALAAREELSQAERKSGRRQKKRVHARKESESREREALAAKLTPGGAASKRIDAREVDAALADAKRKGRVTEGKVVSGASARGGADFTRSAKFFGKMQGEHGSGSKDVAGKKRPSAAPAAPREKAARYML